MQAFGGPPNPPQQGTPASALYGSQSTPSGTSLMGTAMGNQTQMVEGAANRAQQTVGNVQGAKNLEGEMANQRTMQNVNYLQESLARPIEMVEKMGEAKLAQQLYARNREADQRLQTAIMDKGEQMRRDALKWGWSEGYSTYQGSPMATALEKLTKARADRQLWTTLNVAKMLMQGYSLNAQSQTGSIGALQKFQTTARNITKKTEQVNQMKGFIGQAVSVEGKSQILGEIARGNSSGALGALIGSAAKVNPNVAEVIAYLTGGHPEWREDSQSGLPYAEERGPDGNITKTIKASPETMATAALILQETAENARIWLGSDPNSLALGKDFLGAVTKGALAGTQNKAAEPLLYAPKALEVFQDVFNSAITPDGQGLDRGKVMTDFGELIHGLLSFSLPQEYGKIRKDYGAPAFPLSPTTWDRLLKLGADPNQLGSPPVVGPPVTEPPQTTPNWGEPGEGVQ